MMTDRPKVITKLIRTCSDCPHSRYNSGGANICHATGKSFPDREDRKMIQPWCPLDDAPASLM